MNFLTPSDFEPMNRMTKLFWIAFPIAVGRISPAAAILDIGRRQFAQGHNLFLLAVLGLLPFILLAVSVIVASRLLSAFRLACITVGGLIGILAFMIPSHVAVWYPLYRGGHMSSTAVIAFIFIPFYCVPTLVVGVLIGWAASFLPLLRHASETR